MSYVAPAGSLSQIEIVDSSITTSGLVLDGGSNYLLVKNCESSIKPESKCMGFLSNLVAQHGDVVLILKNNVAHRDLHRTLEKRARTIKKLEKDVRDVTGLYNLFADRAAKRTLNDKIEVTS